MLKNKTVKDAGFNTLFDGDANYLFRHGIAPGANAQAGSTTGESQQETGHLDILNDDLLIH